MLAGCYAPMIPEGHPCSVGQECPVPLTCSGGVCVRHPTEDSGIDTTTCTPIVRAGRSNSDVHDEQAPHTPARGMRGRSYRRVADSIAAPKPLWVA